MSFTRAAAELGYVQSNVTAQVKALERELGAPLFDRLGRRVVLTDAGRRLLLYAERILDLHEEARAAVAADGEEPTGTLTLSAPETLCTYRLPRLLHRFRSRYPRVRVTFRPMACDGLEAGVAGGALDVAFLLEGPVKAPSLEVEALVEEPLVLLAAPDHPLAGAGSVDLGDLADDTVLLTEAGCSYRTMFERALAEAGARPTTVLEFGSVEAIKQCVISGMGVAVLPSVVVEAELARGELAALRWAGEGNFGVLTQLVWHKDKWISPALRAFIETSRATLSAGGAPVVPEGIPKGKTPRP